LPKFEVTSNCRVFVEGWRGTTALSAYAFKESGKKSIQVNLIDPIELNGFYQKEDLTFLRDYFQACLDLLNKEVIAEFVDSDRAKV